MSSEKKTYLKERYFGPWPEMVELHGLYKAKLIRDFFGGSESGVPLVDIIDSLATSDVKFFEKELNRIANLSDRDAKLWLERLQKDREWKEQEQKRQEQKQVLKRERAAVRAKRLEESRVFQTLHRNRWRIFLSTTAAAITVWTWTELDDWDFRGPATVVSAVVALICFGFMKGARKLGDDLKRNNPKSSFGLILDISELILGFVAICAAFGVVALLFGHAYLFVAALMISLIVIVFLWPLFLG